MSHHKARGRVFGGDLSPEAQTGAQDVEIVQASGADGRPERQTLGVLLVGGANPTDRTPAHPPRTEGDAFVESVLQFGPSPLGNQIGQGIDRRGGERPGLQPAGSVGEGGSRKLALRFSRLKGGKDGGGSAHEG